MSDESAPQAPAPTAPAAGAPAAPATEPATPAAPVAPDWERKVSTLSSRLAEQERAGMRTGKQLKEALAIKEKYEALERRLTEDPFAVLEERGHGYDKWTDRVLKSGKKPDPLDEKLTPALQKIKELEEKLGAREQAEQTAAQKQDEDRAVTTIRESLTAMGGHDSIIALGQEGVLYQRLKSFADEHGECPPHEQERIAQEFESEIVQSVSAQLTKLAKSPRYRELLAKLIAPEAPAEGVPSEPQGKARSELGRKSSGTESGGKTITQSQVSAVVDRVAEGNAPRSREDRRAAALRRLSA